MVSHIQTKRISNARIARIVVTPTTICASICEHILEFNHIPAGFAIGNFPQPATCRNTYVTFITRCEHIRYGSIARGVLCVEVHCNNVMNQFQCSECEKSFFAKESLRKHMVTHTGVKLYSCSFCQASYAWYNGLKKHMRIQHAGKNCPTEITFQRNKNVC